MNQETIEAIKELENGEGKRFTGSTKELFRELISEHIPAETGEIEIKTLKQIEGDLPPKAMELIKEWGELHKEELQKIWDTQEFIKISPLE